MKTCLSLMYSFGLLFAFLKFLLISIKTQNPSKTSQPKQANTKTNSLATEFSNLSKSLGVTYNTQYLLALLTSLTFSKDHLLCNLRHFFSPFIFAVSALRTLC